MTFRYCCHTDFLDGSFCLDRGEDELALASLFLKDSGKDKSGWERFVEIVTKQRNKIVDSFGPPSPPPNLQDFIMEVTESPDMSTFSFKKILDDNFQVMESQISSTAAGSATSVDVLKISHPRLASLIFVFLV